MLLSIVGTQKSMLSVGMSGNDSWGHAEFELLPHISEGSQEDVGEVILRLGLRELVPLM